jgi:PAP2 superfamily
LAEAQDGTRLARSIGVNPIEAALSALSCVPCDERLLSTRVLDFIADDELLKGGLLIAALCGLWMTGRDRVERLEVRGRVVMTVAGAFAALCVSRLLALLLPFRGRPFELVAGGPPWSYRALESWSAFPSDHAALFFALATGIFVISRRIGTLALLHAVVVITLPRLYLGLHHPTDMLAGGAIGLVCALLATRPLVWRRCALPLLALDGRWVPWLAALAFVVAFEIATLFDGVRNGAKLLWPVVKRSMTPVHAAAVEVSGGIALVVLLIVVAWLVRDYRGSDARQPSSSAR